MSKITIQVDDERIHTQLRLRMERGMSPEEAARDVAEQYNPAPIAELLLPILATSARAIEYQRDRRNERRTLFQRHAGGLTAAERERLSSVSFRTGDGRKVEWGKASWSEHEARILWNETRRDELARDTERHRAAQKLLETEGVDCLDDIPDWQERITEICEHWVDEPTPGDHSTEPDQHESDA
ncbi:hypothetical protein [Phytoactinopolyspora limicola]|uniref:hypothetical protein n=1 Tax=Phytoactinopolyspora limicola TaxID=2715536 RepID=UPI00140E5ECE|nr:hypothetical protein [Phytoactinopolyspora limicola]